MTDIDILCTSLWLLIFISSVPVFEYWYYRYYNIDTTDIDFVPVSDGDFDFWGLAPLSLSLLLGCDRLSLVACRPVAEFGRPFRRFFWGGLVIWLGEESKLYKNY